jgi:hypothetical protein
MPCFIDEPHTLALSCYGEDPRAFPVLKVVKTIIAEFRFVV